MRYDFKKQLRSFGYAWQGIRSCVGKEQNLSFHLIAMTAVTCGICFRHYAHGMDGRYPLFRCGDCRRAVQHRYRKAGGPGISRTAPRCGQVKDIAAGAVLVCAVAAAIIGLIIFIPYL